MPNPEDCPLTMWSSTLDEWELNASLDESVTLMGELISMLSSCSNGSLAQEMSVFSMWTVVTQTLCAATELRNSVTTMRQRTGTLWPAASSETIASDLGLYADLAINGMILSWRPVEMSFLRCARNWSRGHFAAPLTPLRPTLTGGSGRRPCRTNILANWNLMRTQHESCVTGFRSMLREAEIKVRHVPAGLFLILGID